MFPYHLRNVVQNGQKQPKMSKSGVDTADTSCGIFLSSLTVRVT